MQTLLFLGRQMGVKVQKVQRFRNGLVHQFYGLKASQMNKARATVHKYPGPGCSKPRLALIPD